jgi:hypothetical protein
VIVDARPTQFARAVPWVAAFVTAALVAALRWHVGGATFVADEDAYQLQARIFARGAASAPARPVPDAFEQFYVIGTPRTVAKYYPGQGAALAPFEAIGVPDALPVLTAGASAFLLTRLVSAATMAVTGSVAGPLPALFAWLTWLGGGNVLAWHSTLLSQPTSTLLWLVALSAALAWHTVRRRRLLVVVATAVALDALVRPWSAVLLACSLGVAVLASLRAARVSWRDAQRQLVPAFGAGVLIVSVLPLYHRATTGDAARSPHAVYTESTMPYDRLGFGHADSATRALPDDHRVFHRTMREQFARFVPANLPEFVAARLARAREVAVGDWWRLPLVLAAVLAACWWGGAIARVGALTALSVHVGYSLYAFAVTWTAYDLEAAPIWAALTGLGAALAAARARTAARDAASTPTLLAAACAITAVAVVPRALASANDLYAATATSRDFRRAVRGLATQHPEGLVVYVRYANGHDAHRSVVVNAPFSDREPVWVVHVNPATNREVLAKAGRRTPVLAQELPGGQWRLEVAPRPE